jgi:hypothetical protein
MKSIEIFESFVKINNEVNSPKKGEFFISSDGHIIEVLEEPDKNNFVRYRSITSINGIHYNNSYYHINYKLASYLFSSPLPKILRILLT